MSAARSTPMGILAQVYRHGGLKTLSELVVEIENIQADSPVQLDAESVIAAGVASGTLSHRSAGITFIGTTLAGASRDDQSILLDAEALVNGERQREYGHPSENFRNVADMWSVILGTKVTPRQVCLCMTGLKLARASHGDGTRDSLVDACGYLRAIEMMEQSTGT